MNKKLASNFIQLTQDACLKVFWRKSALRFFLQQHQIPDATLAALHSDETKQVYLSKLFADLIKIGDNSGHAVILEMARSLTEMKHFPDLEGWEDSSERISAAHKAVARLNLEMDKLKEQVQDKKDVERRRKEAEETRLAVIASRQTLEKLAEQLSSLVPRQGTQSAGYDFEQWFYQLATYFELVSRPPYKTDGRQIDGSLTLDGTTFLIETKFQKDQVGAPDIDIFMNKITRKADNTMGIFVSMAGFSSVAIQEASRDRTPMLLVDYSHIYNLILPGVMSLPDVIRRIKRHASQTGDAFLAVADFSG